MSIVPTKIVNVTTTETLCRVHACLSPRCTRCILSPRPYIAQTPCNFTPPTITVGYSLEVVELEVVSCVMEKLVNRIAEGGWEFIPSPTVDTLYFRRQKV
jgi:hypothetical protein